MGRIWLSWDQFDELVMDIIKHIRDDNFKPELVVGIARGGLPLMITIASYFGIREVGVMFVQKTMTDEFFSERLTSPVLHGIGLPFEVRNKAVLLVDDIIRSGQSIKTSLGALTELGFQLCQSRYFIQAAGRLRL